MISLRQINDMPAAERDPWYLSLVPPALCRRFGLDAGACTDPTGRCLARVEPLAKRPTVQISLKHRADALDPVFFLRLNETQYGNLEIRLIVLSDPEGPRFNV